MIHQHDSSTHIPPVTPVASNLSGGHRILLVWTIAGFMSAMGLVSIVALLSRPESALSDAVWIGEISFSPDGTAIVANCGRHGVCLWELGGDGSPPKRTPLPKTRDRGDFRTIHFCSASVLMFVGSRQEDKPDVLRAPELVFWDIHQDQEIRSLRLPYVPDAIAMAPEADIAAIAANATEVRDEADCRIIDLVTGATQDRIAIDVGSKALIGKLTLSRNGTHLVVSVCSSGWGLEVWDLRTRKRVLQRDSSVVESISNDGRVIAIWDTKRKYYEFLRLDETAVRAIHDIPLGYIHLLPSGERFIADSLSLELRSTWTGKVLAKLADRDDFDAVGIAVSPLGNMVAAAGDHKIVVWSTDDYTQFAVLKAQAMGE